MRELERLSNNLKKLKRELESGEININPDDKGYIEKECPDKSCMFLFKVNADDWDSKFQQNMVHCPKCNQTSPQNTYWPTDFIDDVKGKIIKHTKDRLFKSRPFPKSLVPYESSAAWNIDIQCEKCRMRYSVIGSAFYCPSCGFNSVESYFETAMNKILLKTSDAKTIEYSLSNSLGVEKAKILAISIKESSLSDIVVSFQHFNKLTYERIAGKKSKQNIFQNLDEGSKLWKDAIGLGFQDWISEVEFKLAIKLFQQRHLLQHTEGIVDQKYIDLSGDNSYQVGDRINVMEVEINKLVEIIMNIYTKIRSYSD